MIESEANPESTLHRFVGGNKETLNKEGVREALLKFHEEWYSANLMCLVVYSNFPIDKLSLLVNEKFQHIQNKELPLPNFKDEKPYDERNLGYFYKVNSVVDFDELNIHFVIPYS